MELQEYKTYKRNPNQIITRANPHICYLKIHIFARVISIQACSLQCNQLPTRQSNLYQYIYAAENTHICTCYKYPSMQPTMQPTSYPSKQPISIHLCSLQHHLCSLQHHLCSLFCSRMTVTGCSKERLTTVIAKRILNHY